jgi:hypothetical protein
MISNEHFLIQFVGKATHGLLRWGRMGVSYSLVTEETRTGYAKQVISSPILSKLSDQIGNRPSRGPTPCIHQR